MLYDPQNPLTDEQLEELGKEDFNKVLEYLDQITAHQNRIPMPESQRDMKIVKMFHDKGYDRKKLKE